LVSTVYDKIDIARILIERIDGALATARVSTLALANSVLQRWAGDAPEKGEDRCEIRIIFEDGFQYCSRIGLKRTQKRISLSRHLRQQALGMAPAQETAPNKTTYGSTSAPALNTHLSIETMLAKYDL
jgi:hypothetical protein